MDNYYRDTLALKNRANNIISLDEYQAKLFTDAPELATRINWDFLQSGACYSNALFLCYFNDIFDELGDEWLDYCEGLVICRIALLSDTPTAVHHSWIYSSKYNCYVDCTPEHRPNYQPNMCLYFLSDTLSNYELSDYLDSLEDDDGEYNPRFIHKDVELGMKVPKEWLM